MTLSVSPETVPLSREIVSPLGLGGVPLFPGIQPSLDGPQDPETLVPLNEFHET